MISSYQSSRETFLCLVIINQLANPLRTQLYPKLPLTVEICRNYPFMHIDVMNCVVVVYAIHFRLRIWLVDNGVATKMAAVMIQAKPTFYPVHSQNSSSISADQFGKNLITEIFCVANHTTKNCSLIDCSYDILFIEKMVWNNCLASWMRLSSRMSLWIVYNMFKLRFIERECVCKERNRFDMGERARSFNKHFEETAQRNPGIAKERILREQFQKHKHFALKRQTL